VIERLKERAELVSCEPGQVVEQEGEPADAFYLVRGGFVKVSVTAGSSELAVTYLRKGDYAGEAALLIDEAWPFTLQALDHAELVKISKQEFKEITARSPGLEDVLWREAVARLKARAAALENPTRSEYVQMAMETGLIHGDSVLLIDLATCTRCDDCVRGCADAHGGVPRFVREGQKYRNWLIPTACYQCTDPVCMIDCPTGAIARAIGTLEVTINDATCIGCGNCAERCPWGNIVMVETEEKRPDGKPVELATKCDLCLTRPEGPACVQMCPHGSAVRISFKDLERVTQLLR
jgi:Fe-S-cluster-containing hydrogenase component 2